MSQVYKNNAGGGGSGIITIDGDIGSITGSTVTIYADNAANHSGSSVLFNNSGTVSTLNLTDANGNTYLGKGCGIPGGGNNTAIGIFAMSSAVTASECVAIGQSALNAYVLGGECVAIGAGTLGSLVSGGANIAIGFETMDLLLTGSDNIAIGDGAADTYTGAETGNIIIAANGVTGESHTTRIGTQTGTGSGPQTACYIAGITGNTVSNTEMVTIDSVTGQLGVTSLLSQKYPITPFVVGPVGLAGYQTIQAGLDAANAAGGGSVYVQTGNYVENLVFYPNVQIVGVTGNSDETGVGTDITITGTHTPSDTGYTTISNVYFESTGDIFFSTDAGTCDIALQNCNIGITGSG